MDGNNGTFLDIDVFNSHLCLTSSTADSSLFDLLSERLPHTVLPALHNPLRHARPNHLVPILPLLDNLIYEFIYRQGLYHN